MVPLGIQQRPFQKSSPEAVEQWVTGPHRSISIIVNALLSTALPVPPLESPVLLVCLEENAS
jgi:hypothetical protein